MALVGSRSPHPSTPAPGAAIRLHGLALYSMTAIFAPNLAIWLTGQWTDQWTDWRLIYWHIIPLGMLAIPLVAWGMPAMPPVLARFKETNWFGMACGTVGLSLLAIARTRKAQGKVESSLTAILPHQTVHALAAVRR